MRAVPVLSTLAELARRGAIAEATVLLERDWVELMFRADAEQMRRLVTLVRPANTGPGWRFIAACRPKTADASRSPRTAR